VIHVPVTTPICPTCGCSLLRLGIAKADATVRPHHGQELLFCCDGCADDFAIAPQQYLDQVRDWVVCPSCLAEKPTSMTVTITHDGDTVHLCRCPGCRAAFRANADALLARLAA
jgi:hypothetical protein